MSKGQSPTNLGRLVDNWPSISLRVGLVGLLGTREQLVPGRPRGYVGLPGFVADHFEIAERVKLKS